MSIPAAVVTCSDRCHAGAAEDRSGAELVALLAGHDVRSPAPVVVPDEAGQIREAISRAISAGARVIVTTGGTGVGPRDVTPEATRSLLDYEIPGLMEEVRRRGAEHVPRALLSRGIAGVASVGGHPRAIVLNVPGSTGGVRDAIAVVGPLLAHLVEQLDGGDH